MDYPGKFNAYWRAVATASEQAKISKLTALVSVLKAKFCYGIGPMFHSMFELSKIDAAAWKNYITDKPLERALNQINLKQNRAVISDKMLFWHHCQQHQLQTAEIYNRSDDLMPLAKTEFLAAVPASCQALFIKQAKGSGGEGAFAASKKHGIWHFQGQTGSLAELYQYCQLNCANEFGWLIQPKLNSHPAIAEISGAEGLSTLRLVSNRQGNSVKLAYGVIKIALAGNIIDNFKNGCTGNMVAAINLDSGTLGAAKGSLNKLWPVINSFTHSPYSANPIEGVTLPNWHETKELITRAHLSFENLPSIGWDLAITDNGPLLVEGNTNYGADLLQVAYGRGLRQELIVELQNLVKS